MSPPATKRGSCWVTTRLWPAAGKGVSACTNHFRTRSCRPAIAAEMRAFDRLEKRGIGRLAVSDVIKQLDVVPARATVP